MKSAGHLARMKYDRETKTVMLWTPKALAGRAQSLISRELDVKMNVWRIQPALANIEDMLLKFNGLTEYVDPVIYQILERERSKAFLFQKFKGLLVDAKFAPYDWFRKPLPHQVSATAAGLER